RNRSQTQQTTEAGFCFLLATRAILDVAGHDLWTLHPAALRPIPGQAYMLMLAAEEPFTVTTLAKEMGVSSATARRIVGDLEARGLVHRERRKVLPVEGADLDQAAGAALGYRASLWERFQEDTQRNDASKAEWLAQQRAERQKPGQWM